MLFVYQVLPHQASLRGLMPSSLPPLQSHRLPCFSSDTPVNLSPQGLCTAILSACITVLGNHMTCSFALFRFCTNTTLSESKTFIFICDNLIFKEDYIHGLLILIKKNGKDKKPPFHFFFFFKLWVAGSPVSHSPFPSGVLD